MKIHEYQAKALLAPYGVATPAGVACFTADEAVEAARRAGGDAWMVKAQIHAGERGPAGGVRIARSIDEVRFLAGDLLGRTLVTAQTGPGGRRVRRLLVEQALDVRQALRVGLGIDRASERVALAASNGAGARHKAIVDPATGVTAAQADALSRQMGLSDAASTAARGMLQGLYRAFVAMEALAADIDLAVTADDRVVALDARLDIDPNALFRHPEIAALRDLDEEDPDELEASRFDLVYIALDGNIGCLVNGAGLAMATMDLIKLDGGAPANFLDVGGDATAGQVTEAFKLMMRKRGVKAILVNIFGGIMRCDVIAAGIVEAMRQIDLTVPLVVRLTGTNEDIGMRILRKSGLPIIAAHDMAEAAIKAVRAAGGH